jgi:hypothetical protein
VEVERLRDRIEVGQDESLDVRVRHFDGVVEFFQTLFCQLHLKRKATDDNVFQMLTNGVKHFVGVIYTAISIK